MHITLFSSCQTSNSGFGHLHRAAGCTALLRCCRPNLTLKLIELLNVTNFNAPNELFLGKIINAMTLTNLVLNANANISPSRSHLSDVTLDFIFPDGDTASYFSDDQPIGFNVNIIDLSSVEFWKTTPASSVDLIDSTSSASLPSQISVDIDVKNGLYYVTPPCAEKQDACHELGGSASGPTQRNGTPSACRRIGI